MFRDRCHWVSFAIAILTASSANIATSLSQSNPLKINNKTKVKSGGKKEEEEGQCDGQLGDEEKVKGKYESNPGGEEEGNGGQDMDVTRQGDDTERGDQR